MYTVQAVLRQWLISGRLEHISTNEAEATLDDILGTAAPERAVAESPERLLRQGTGSRVLRWLACGS